MDSYKFVPIDNVSGHTHGVLITSGKLAGMIVVFGKVIFRGEDDQGRGVFAYEHTVVQYPPGRFFITDNAIQKVIGPILNDIMMQSAKSVDEEQYETEIEAAQKFAAQFPQEPIMQVDENTTVEFEEVPLDGGND